MRIEKINNNIREVNDLINYYHKNNRITVEQLLYDSKQNELSELQPLIQNIYKKWRNNKFYIEKARYYLSKINLANSKNIFTLKKYNFNETDNDNEIDLLKIVGENLKVIDYSLEGDFYEWCECRYSNHLSHVIWDMLPPIACDVYLLI